MIVRDPGPQGQCVLAGNEISAFIRGANLGIQSISCRVHVQCFVKPSKQSLGL